MIVPTVAILAGGRSERMGRDKAAIVWRGETLLERAARVARQAGFSVAVIGRAMPAHWPFAEVVFAPDEQAGQGPLAGILTALTLFDGPVIVLATDMPLLRVETLRWLVSQPSGPHGVAAVNGGQWEPLFSLYDPAAAPLMRRHLAEGRRSLHAVLQAGEFRVATVPPDIAATLVNVNTESDLAGLDSLGLF